MKIAFFIVFILLISSCKSKKNIVETTPKVEVKHFETISLKEVNKFKKDRAFDLGKRLLETCNTSVFIAFNKNEATDQVIKNATVDRISKTCKSILHRNGKFIDIQLLEVTHNLETDDFIFRYKINYEKKYFERELYVTVNSAGKVSSLKTKELPKKPM